MPKDSFQLEGINNIIFDLGKVVINLDIDATDKAFEELLGDSYQDVMHQLRSEGFFESYETRHITTQEFVSRIGQLIGGPAIDQKIVMAWNAMLLDIPQERLQILDWAKSKYRTFCLSNTNELHINHIHEYLRTKMKIESLEPYFEEVYLSHEVGMRKPDKEIFEYVLNKNGLKAVNTLFIDDTVGHLEGAKKIGIKTFHMQDDVNLEMLFNPYIHEV